MGLDTVELMCEIEKFFAINIRDEQAEQIATIQDAVQCVAGMLHITNQSTTLRNQLQEQVQKLLLQLGLATEPVMPEAAIFTILNPQDKGIWQQFAQQLQLTVPVPRYTDYETKSWFNKMIMLRPAYPYQELTLQHFLDVLCITNYQKLLKGVSMRDAYDIYTAVAGITLRVTGVDPYEIGPDKSFTDDLGMD